MEIRVLELSVGPEERWKRSSRTACGVQGQTVDGGESERLNNLELEIFLATSESDGYGLLFSPIHRKYREMPQARQGILPR